MVKKLIAIMTVAVLLLMSVIGCGTPTPTGTQTTGTTVTQASTTAAPKVTDWKNFKIDPSKISKEKLNTTLYVGASVRGLDNPYIVTIIDGMDMFCQYLDSIGQKYEKQTLDSGGSNDKEIDNMKQFSAKGNGNSIVYSDPNESAIAEPLVQAMADGNNYIGVAWSKPADTNPWDYDPNWVVYTSPDNVKNGELISEELFKAMGDKGKIFVVNGMMANTAATDRRKGLENALKNHPNIQIVSEDTANWDTKQALNLVETWLNKTPDVAGIWCANDSMAAGAIQALDKAGKKGKMPVVGVDGTADMIRAIESGDATATVYSNGYLQSGYTLALCYAVWSGQVNPADLPHEYRVFATVAPLVTKANSAQMLKDYVDGKPKFDFSNIFFCKAD